MKITIVLGAFFPIPPIMGGAVEKVWFALGREFARRGHEVIEISRAHPALPRTEQIDQMTHTRIPGFDQPRSIIWLKFFDLIYSLRVRRVLPKADILITNTFWLPMLERRQRHGLVCVNVQRVPKGQMRSYSHVARLLAVSRAIADEIIAQAPELQPKVRVLPNPVPFEIENGTTVARSNTILFVGRIHPEKGIELLLAAMRSLPEDVLRKWKLRIVGPHETRLGGGGDNFLRAMQRLNGSVEWIGPIFDETQLRSEFRSASIFVYPSIAEYGEAFPVAPLEAMANGCVPLVSNLNCFRDYIEDGVTGFVFDHRSGEKALRDRLAYLLRLSREELLKISDAGRSKAAELSIQSVAERYLEDFASLLSPR